MDTAPARSPDLHFRILEAPAKSILSPVSGFIAKAGFTHSLTPARNCTFGCTYCYVPTLRIYAGLKREDWTHWGHFTTYKSNAPELLRHELRPTQRIYCSPLTDPYQPAEATQRIMPAILRAVTERPPAVFTIQTRGPLILRDLDLLLAASRATRLRVSFSITTDRDDVRRIFEPHCAPIPERWQVIRQLRAAGITTFATLAPLLPCNPETFIAQALECTDGPIIADPFHVPALKRNGAQTREAAHGICRHHNWTEWLEGDFQLATLRTMQSVAAKASRSFGWGTSGFAALAV